MAGHQSTTAGTSKQGGYVAPERTEAVYFENTLLRVFGVLFCHDPKQARTRTGKIEIDRGVKERNITVRLHPEYAQPGPFAHKVAVAIIRKQSSYGRPIRKEIAFSQRELMRLAGRSTWGGRDSEELALALKQIRYTHVIAHFKTKDRFIEHDFSIFNEVLIERRSSPTDPIVACTVVLADPIVRSLDDKHFTCLNQSLLDQLGTIGQALYMRLFFHFATHYDGHHKNRVTFQKRYDAICAEWLGGLTVLKYKSKIEREQLGPHLAKLVDIGFLASYAITQAKTVEGLVIAFRPGRKFFADYERFYTNRFQGKVRFEFRDEQRATADPHRVAYLFVQKRTGKPLDGIPYVSSKEVETAKFFLEHLSVEDVPDFFDYAFAEAAKTRFDVQALGGLRPYLEGYLRSLEQRPTAKAAAARRMATEREAQDRTDYDRFRRAAADGLFASLPAGERETIEELATGHRRPTTGRGSGFLAKTLFEIERARITAERHPGRIPTFDQWRAGRRTLH